jgi:hypothetical protein
MRLYRYVGPKRIAERVGPEPTGVPIRSPDDVRTWVRELGQESIAGCVIVTFVVDASGELLVADRHSEHVACAGDRAVQSAGEMTFAVGRSVEVVAVSNQSTGYCPDVGCESLTLVKAGVFECGVCGSDLPAGYNVQ